MSSGRTSRACIIALALVIGGAACESNSAEPRTTAEQAPSSVPAAPVTSPPAASHNAVTTPQPTSTNQWESRAPQLSDADMPPLPEVPFPPARPMEIVRAVYVFAARHPEVLSHVPCFCGCESRGHKHNDDCFVSERDARGRPTKWEPHGIG
jgi:uncharacterized protein with PCYCGC motif